VFCFCATCRCDFNKYTLQYIAKLGVIRSAMKVQEDMDIDNLTGILPSACFNPLHLRFLGTEKSFVAGIILGKISVKCYIEKMESFHKPYGTV
jgi:hypothetical protein